MNRRGFLAGLLGAALFASQAGAGVFPIREKTAAATYTGPGDIVSSATAWYGLRAYNAAYASPGTNKSVNLRRASDNTTCDFVIASSGNLGNTASGCSLGGGLSLAAFATQDATCTGTIASTTLTCASASSTPHAGSTLTGTGLTQPSYIVSCGTFTGGAGTCTLNASQTISVGETITMTYGLYVTEAYDQSGANACTSAPCNATQSTAGTQPGLLPNCFGGRPCLRFASPGMDLVLVGSPLSASTSFTVSTVSERTSAFTSYGAIFGNSAFALFNNSANSVVSYAGSFGSATTASDSALHAMQFIFAGASSYVNVDGVAGTVGAAGGAALGTTPAWGYTSGNPLNGLSAEVGLWSGNFTSGQNTGMNANQASYY